MDIEQIYFLDPKYFYSLQCGSTSMAAFFLTPFDEIDLACTCPPFLAGTIPAYTIVFTLIFLSLLT